MNPDKIDITGLDKGAVVAALYNRGQSQGLGIMVNLTHIAKNGGGLMTADEANRLITKQGMYFDYLNGRVMKVSVEDDIMDVWLYDRDNGQGAALRALQSAGLK